MREQETHAAFSMTLSRAVIRPQIIADARRLFFSSSAIICANLRTDICLVALRCSAVFVAFSNHAALSGAGSN